MHFSTKQPFIRLAISKNRKFAEALIAFCGRPSSSTRDFSRPRPSAPTQSAPPPVAAVDFLVILQASSVDFSTDAVCRLRRSQPTLPLMLSLPVSDQKKRAFDALERRFALARADLQEVQLKKRKESSKKQQNGKLELFGKTSQKRISSKTGADFHPVYSELFEGINNKLLNSGSNASSRADVVNKVVYDLLQHGEEWNKFRRTSLKKKMYHGILLDNFVSNVGVSTNARAKALQNHSKRSQNHMSQRQHRKCGSFDMPKEFHRFEHFKPMHDLWKAYILELLEKSNKKQLAQCLLMADLHGAFITVVECKTVSFVGVSGLMIRETTETFGIMKQDNHFRVVPKRGSVFIFQAGCWKVTLHGDKLSLRTSPNA